MSWDAAPGADDRLPEHVVAARSRVDRGSPALARIVARLSDLLVVETRLPLVEAVAVCAGPGGWKASCMLRDRDDRRGGAIAAHVATLAVSCEGRFLAWMPYGDGTGDPTLASSWELRPPTAWVRAAGKTGSACLAAAREKSRDAAAERLSRWLPGATRDRVLLEAATAGWRR